MRTHYEALINDTGAQGEGAGRLLAFGTNGRLELYREALRGARGRETLGTGAGTFRFTHFEQRSGGIVKHAHSEWFNIYSELGVVGLALFAVAVAGLLVAAFARLFKDRSDPDRALLAALQAGIVAFVFHISVDWDWGMASVTLAFLLFAAHRRRRIADPGGGGLRRPPPGATVEGEARAQAAAGRRGACRWRPAPSPPAWSRIGVVSWTLPYLSERVLQRGRQRGGPGPHRGGRLGRETGARGSTRWPSIL